MSESRYTVICFDHGGYSKEGDDMKWISGEDQIHTLVMKTSLEEVSYSGLVERICRKLMMDEVTTQLKMSYFPLVLNPKNPSYIWSDEDVFGYLLQVNKDQCRSLLHVEFIKDVDQNQGCVQVSTENHETYVEEELVSSGRDDNECMMTLCTGEPSEDHKLQDHVTESVEGDEYVCEDTEVRPSVGDEHVNLEWDDGIDMVLGQEFGSKEAVQTLVQIASLHNCFEYDTIKSDTKRYVIRCSGAKNGCKWSVRAAKHKNSDRFTVSTYNKLHTCSRVTTSASRNRRRVTPRLVASVLAEDYPGRFDTPTPKSLMDMVQGKIGVNVSYSTALRGKNLAANDVRGSPEESYRMLYPYMHMLESMNPGTRTCVEIDEENRFKYLFFALGACIEGFQAMRKVIIVDVTHLKNVYGGVLIAATSQDPNDHHYPLAFGVIDGEKETSWKWFFNQLKAVVTDVPEMVFIADINAGLIKSIHEVFPLAKHRYCIWHLSQNVKLNVAKHRDTCAKKFRDCAHAYTESEFITLYGAFRTKYPACAAYLDRSVEAKYWARCYFPGEWYKIDTTNCAESINRILVQARKYSLLPMIDVIVAKLAECWNVRRKSSAEIPTTQKLIQQNNLVEQWSWIYSRTIYPVPHMSDWTVSDDIRAQEVLPPHYEKRKEKRNKQDFHQLDNTVEKEKEEDWDAGLSC